MGSRKTSSILLLAVCLGASLAQAEHATILPAPQQITYGSAHFAAGRATRFACHPVRRKMTASPPRTLAACITYATGSQTPILTGAA